MVDRNWTRGIALAAVAGGLALALAAAPLAPGAALAKGASENGVDNSGGKAGGNGNSNGGGGGSSSSGSAPGLAIGNSGFGGEDGPGNGHGLALGHDKDAVSGVDGSEEGIHPDNYGALASILGSLNAAHAIANGNTNNNLNSKVGQIRAYMEAFNDYTNDVDALVETEISDVAEALITASNRDLEAMNANTVEEVVNGVNDLLGDGIVADHEALTNAERAVAEEISDPPPL